MTEYVRSARVFTVRRPTDTNMCIGGWGEMNCIHFLKVTHGWSRGGGGSEHMTKNGNEFNYWGAFSLGARMTVLGLVTARRTLLVYGRLKSSGNHINRPIKGISISFIDCNSLCVFQISVFFILLKTMHSMMSLATSGV